MATIDTDTSVKFTFMNGELTVTATLGHAKPNAELSDTILTTAGNEIKTLGSYDALKGITVIDKVSYERV